MQTDDANRFRDLLRGMGRVFGSEPDAVVLDAYWLALRDWSLKDFEGACGHLLKTAKFMPRPHDFTELRKADRLTAGEAWSEVLAIVRAGGNSHDDPVVTQAVRAIGGFNAIGMSHTDQTHFLEKRFNEHYESINDAEDVRAALPNIAGPSRLPGAAKLLLQNMTKDARRIAEDRT